MERNGVKRNGVRVRPLPASIIKQRRPYFLTINLQLCEGRKIMAERSNALSEMARFWLQERYGLLLRESVPVKLKRNNSDIDFVVASPAGPVTLLDRIIFTNAIVETKDERDFDPHGADFAKRLRSDYERLQGNRMISDETTCCFSMLRKEHHAEAEKIFGQGADFAKIFIFHDLKKNGIEDMLAELRSRNIHVVTSFEMLSDIQKFFRDPQPAQAKKSGPDSQNLRAPLFRSGAGVRNSLVGDILDMLVTYHGWEQAQG
jgi:hypothetical protein